MRLCPLEPNGHNSEIPAGTQSGSQENACVGSYTPSHNNKLPLELDYIEDVNIEFTYVLFSDSQLGLRSLVAITSHR